LEEWKDAIWQKARTRGVHVSVAVAPLAEDVEALRHQEVEVIFRPSHSFNAWDSFNELNSIAQSFSFISQP